MVGAVTCFARGQNMLGEGPCWDDRTGRLVWVDIKARTIESAAMGGFRNKLKLTFAPTLTCA